MAENTAIEWCDHTFNPWWGCQKVSPACDHCYAERDAKRFAAVKVLWGVDSQRRTFGEKHWKAPKDWNDKARESREQIGHLHERPRVFCASMGDWLDLDAPIGEFIKLLRLIEHTPELDWLLLSKRIGNWRKRVQQAVDQVDASMSFVPRWAEGWLNGNPPANVWLGATIVNQAEYDRDIGKLLRIPARIHFLSVEPMLGAIDMRLGGASAPDYAEHRPLAPLSWVICGGESGPGARPMHPDWARSLRDQCKAAGVPFLFKQWGEWVAGCGPDGEGPTRHRWMGSAYSTKVGKKAAGRLLDGVQHDGFPT